MRHWGEKGGWREEWAGREREGWEMRGGRTRGWGESGLVEKERAGREGMREKVLKENKRVGSEREVGEGEVGKRRRRREREGVGRECR